MLSCCSVSIGGLDSLANNQTPAPGAPTGGIRQNAELLREMSTLGALRLEHVENFYLAKSYCPQVKLVVAEDNEAVIKIIKRADPPS